MLGFNIDIIIFSLFLIINLAIGLFSSRRVNSLRDYAVGRKDFSTATLTAAIMVSWIGGMYVFEILEHTYRDGLYFIIVIIGACLCLWLVGLLAVRMREFLKNLSVAEAMGDLYGRSVQIITAISGVCSVLAAVAIEFKVISKVISLIFGTESSWVPIIASAVVIIYSVSGGIRAITFTDVVQFFTFGMFIPILALIIWNQLKDPKQVITLLSTHPNFSWSQVIGWHPKFAESLTMLLWFMLPAMDPVVFQRVSMARDVEQVKQSFSYAALISLVVCLFLGWIAILLLASNPNLEPNKLFNHVITTYTPEGLRGLIGVGVLALAMSTADSYLNASAVLLTNDIAKPLGIDLKKENEVLIARFLCLVTGLLALLVTIRFKGMLSLLRFSNGFYMPVVTVPLLMAILGFRSSTRSVLVGMCLGFSTVLVWPFIFKGGDGIISGIIANLVGLLGSHYLLKQPGGWVGVKASGSLLEARQARKDAWINWVRIIKNTDVYDYFQNNLPSREIVYLLTAIYILFSTYLGLYLLKDDLITQYPRLQYIIFHSVLFIVAMLIIYPIWSEGLKKSKYLIMVMAGWYLSVLYIFFFLSSLLALFSGLQQEFIFIFVGNLIIASFVIPFPVFIGMFLFALPLSWVIFKAITGVPALPTAFNFWQFKLIYMWIFLGSALVTIFNIRSKYASEKANSRRLQLEKLEVELKARIFNLLQDKSVVYETEINPAHAGVNVLIDKLGEVLDRLKEKLQQFSVLHLNTILNEKLAIEYWSSIFIGFDHTMQQLSDRLTLSLSKLSPTELISQALESYRERVSRHSEVLVTFLTTFKKVECDVEKLKLLISNTLQRAQIYNPNRKPLILRIEDSVIVYKIDHSRIQELREKAIKITITTFHKGVEEKDFYIASPKTEIDDRNIGNILEPVLLENISIVDIHYGYMGEEICTAMDYQQFYVLPIKLGRLTKSRRLLDQWITA
ncbi:MAG: hypothetical protein BGO68_01745 [Candidatus Amoebophilus sp. 36-38]|nr:MAG: hypothetical protein BGO68_01745 [Candidatus Amoebophilus sp. 36-38]